MITCIIIQLGSVIDSAQSSGKERRDNCSFANLKELWNSENPESSKEILEKIDNLTHSYAELKDYRNKLVAHKDLGKIFDHSFDRIKPLESLDTFIDICKQILDQCDEIISDSFLQRFSIRMRKYDYETEKAQSIEALLSLVENGTKMEAPNDQL